MRKLVSFSVISLILGAFICVGCATSAPPMGLNDKIELHNGQVINQHIKSYESNTLTLQDNKRVPRDDVKEIVFIMPQAEEKAKESQQSLSPAQIKALFKQADEATKKYPYSNGITILDNGVHTLNPDGSRKFWYHFIGKVLTNKNKDWADLSLYFEEERSRAKIIMGRTVTPEGRVLDLDLSTVKITAPSREMEFFGKGKIISASLPSVEVGCLLEYIFEVDDFNPADKNLFEPDFYFQDNDPVLDSRVSIIIPADKELNYVTKNMAAANDKPKITTTKDTKTYVWELTNVPPLIEEPNMPVMADVAPQVHCTLFKDWTYLNNWSTEILKERLKTTPAITQLTKDLTKDCKTIEEKIAAICYFIQKEIRYISIKGSASSGWGGHPAYQTLQNKYGDCIDKTILFTTMLRELGVEAYPVTVLTNDVGTAVRDIPILQSNHAIVELHLNGRMFFLDGVTQYYRYPYINPTDHGVTAVNPLTGKINFIDVPPPDYNMKSYATELSINPNGNVGGIVHGEYTGDYEAGLRGFWESVPEAQRQDVFQQTVGNLSPGGQLLEFGINNLPDLSKQLSLDYKYILPDYPIFAGDLMIFGIPGLDYDFPEIALDVRHYDLVYTTSKEYRHQISVKIPDGYKIKYLPEPVDLTCLDYGTYKATYTYQADKNSILFEDDFKLFKRYISVKDYPAYKAFLQQVSKFSKEKIFFQSTGSDNKNINTNNTNKSE